MCASVGCYSCPDALPSRYSHVKQVALTLSLAELPPSEPGPIQSTSDHPAYRLSRPPPQSPHTDCSHRLCHSPPGGIRSPESLLLTTDKLRQFSVKATEIPAHPSTSSAHSRLLTTPGAGRYPQSFSSTPALMPIALLPVKRGLVREEVNVPWTRIGGSQTIERIRKGRLPGKSGRRKGDSI